MPGIFAHRSNPKIIHWKEPQKDLSEVHEWLEGCIRCDNSWNFVIHHRPSDLKDEDIGTHLLEPSDEDKNAVLGLCGVHTVPEIGYTLDPAVWGKGIATEAVAGLVKKYWETFPDGHPRLEGEERTYLEAHTDIDYLPSQAVLRKNGFVLSKVVEAREENGDPWTCMVWRKWKPGHGNTEDQEQKQASDEGNEATARKE